MPLGLIRTIIAWMGQKINVGIVNLRGIIIAGLCPAPRLNLS